MLPIGFPEFVQHREDLARDRDDDFAHDVTGESQRVELLNAFTRALGVHGGEEGKADSDTNGREQTNCVWDSHNGDSVQGKYMATTQKRNWEGGGWQMIW